MIGLKNYFKTSIKKGGAPGRVLRVSSQIMLICVMGGRGWLWQSRRGGRWGEMWGTRVHMMWCGMSKVLTLVNFLRHFFLPCLIECWLFTWPSKSQPWGEYKELSACKSRLWFFSPLSSWRSMSQCPISPGVFSPAVARNGLSPVIPNPYMDSHIASSESFWQLYLIWSVKGDLLSYVWPQ